MERKLLHAQRRMEIDAFEIGPSEMLVVGQIKDLRPRTYRTVSGRLQNAGTVHGMHVELEVSLPDLTITAARASMPETPMAECKEVAPVIGEIVGLKIVAGFARELRKRIGGPRGCAHLSSLIQAMGPVAVHGASLQLEQGPVEQRVKVADDHVINTCHLMREDGPIVKRFRGQVGGE